jgi:hypothetical protein
MSANPKNTVCIDAATATLVKETAERLSRSGPFEGASSAQLEARIWIGIALSLDPATACANISFARGRAIFSAALQAALLARSTRYGYEPGVMTEEKAEITFHRDGTPFRVADFTITEARRAKLTDKAVWQAYPSDLLFARALTRGIRRYAPDLLAGNVSYTTEEIGGNTHESIPRMRDKPTMNGESESPSASKPGRGTVTDEQLQNLKACRDELQIPMETWRGQILAKRNVKSATELTAEQAAELLSALCTRINVSQMEEETARQDRERIAQRNGDLTVDVSPLSNGAKEKEVTEAAGSNCKRK